MAEASSGERSISFERVHAWAEDKDTYLTIEDHDLVGTGSVIITLPRHDAATRDIRKLLERMGRKVD